MFGQLPSARVGAVGAMFGNAPIICCGYDGFGSPSYLDTCIYYQESRWSQSHSMIHKRMHAAGVQINSTTFWILGGQNIQNQLEISDTTEFIIQDQTNGIPGPKLPYKLTGLCSVKLSETEIFVIGGWDGSGWSSKNMY